MEKQTVISIEEIFDTRREEFASSAHRQAWYLGASLLPFSPVIPAGHSPYEAEEMILSERSLHGFLSALYADLYQDPGAYKLVESPDLVFEDGQWYKDRPDMIRAKGKNAHAQKSIEALFEMGRRAVLDGDDLVLSAAEYDAILAGLKPNSVSRPKVKAFLAALERLGLEIVPAPGHVILRASLYPKMLIAIKALCHYGGGKDHLERIFAFQRCDFEAVRDIYTPDVSRVLTILPPEARRQAQGIIDFMSGAGYRMELRMGGYPSDLWQIQFRGSKKYKASDFFWLGFSLEYRHRFHVELHCINPQYLIPIVTRQGVETAAWFDGMWNKECDNCGYCQDKFTNPGPYWLEYDGKRRGLCHQCWIRVYNPSDERVEDLLKMIDLHSQAGMAG